MARRRKPHEDEFSDETRAELDRLRDLQERMNRLLPDKAKYIDNTALLSRMVAAGLSQEEMEKLKAKLDWKPGHHKREARAAHHRAEIERMNRDGLTDGQIAHALGLSRPYVCQIRGANGIPAVRRKR